jgi:hypothetical protein
LAASISLSITQNSQSVANNTSNVTVAVSVKWSYGSWNATGECYGSITIDGTKYSFSGIKFNTSASTSGSQVIMTKTVNVGHNSDGTKTLSCSASFYTGLSSSGTQTASGSKTLTTIPRKSSLSASNGTLGTAQTLTVTRQATSFTHTITYKCGSASGTICTKSTNTSISWTPPLSLAQQNTTGTSVSVTFTITTYSGNTNVGSNTTAITCAIPASVKPSVSIAVSDPTGNAGSFGAYVQGQSKLKIVATASGSQGSTIKSYKTTADGKTFTAATVTTGVVNGTGTLTITATVTDSRGRTATASTTISVLKYEYPKINSLTVSRRDYDANGENYVKSGYLEVKFSSEITALNNKNTATYSIQYKKMTATSYTTETMSDLDGQYSVSGGVFVFRADTASSYNIVLSVADAFKTVAKTGTGSSMKMLYSILKRNLGLALGKIAELEGVFEIAFQTMFTGGIRQPVLEAGTDFDDVIIPNTYTLKNCNSAGYGHCPVTTGTGSLSIETVGEEGQLRQIVTVCHKTNPLRYERFYYGGSWGNWLSVGVSFQELS